MTEPRTPSDLDEFDAAVRELAARGLGPTEIAKELSESIGQPVPRGRVRRSLARLKRTKAFTSPEAPSETPSLESFDRELARALEIGDSVAAARWARARKAYLESEIDATSTRAAERKPEEEEHWDRLSDWQVQVMSALVHILHGDPITSMDQEALIKLEGQKDVPAPECRGCYLPCAATDCLCETCLDQFRALRSGRGIPGAVALAPLPRELAPLPRELAPAPAPPPPAPRTKSILDR